MNEPIEAFYERELLFLEEAIRPFAERYPANAKNLVPETGRSIDPHLERLIEGFALLTGRVRHKVDSEFPELIESLLQVLYPHLGLIIPSMAIARAHAPAAGFDLRNGWHIDKHTAVHSSAFGQHGETYRYRVGYPVTLWPITLTDATWEASPVGLGVAAPHGTAAVLRLCLACNDELTWDDLRIDRLRFYLSGERRFIADLYDSLFNRCLGVVMRPADAAANRPVRLEAARCVHPVGLELDDGLLPFPAEAFVGHRLLMELLSFPQKFLFADLAGFDEIRGRGFGNAVEVLLFFGQAQDNLERSLSAQNLVLGCTPVINVFPQSCEPIDVHHRHSEYRVVPNRLQPRSMEVLRIDSVRQLDHDTGQMRNVLPFFGSRFGEPPEPHAYFHVRRRDSVVEDVPGTEVYLSIVDPEFDPGKGRREILDVHALCTNRDQPFKIQQAGDRLRGAAGGGRGWLELLHKPTPPLRRGLGHAAYWRLVSQNALNHVSLIEGDGALAALRETLRLCDFSGILTQQLAAVNQQIIEGIQNVGSRPIMQRFRGGSPHTALCRGMEIDVQFDEDKYSGTGVVLVAAVLERFFALYTGLNSFTRLVARTAQAEGALKTWPPRAGQDPLP
jgi:type VI secretion system protein ImpG